MKYFLFTFYDKYSHISYKIKYKNHKHQDFFNFKLRYKIMAWDHNYTSYKTNDLLKIVYV